MSTATSYTILTALEAELGRPRVVAMAEAYLSAPTPPRLPRLRISEAIPLATLDTLQLSPIPHHTPNGGAVTPPGFDYGSPRPAPRTDDVYWQPGGWTPPLSPIPSPPPGGAATPPGYDYGPPRPAPRTDNIYSPPRLVRAPGASFMEPLPVTPPRAARSPRSPPGAPARPRSRPATGDESEANNELMNILPTDLSGALGHICEVDEDEEQLKNAMWAALGRAERELTPEAIAATRAAMAAYDSNGHRSADRSYVEQGLIEVEAVMPWIDLTSMANCPDDY